MARLQAANFSDPRRNKSTSPFQKQELARNKNLVLAGGGIWPQVGVEYLGCSDKRKPSTEYEFT